MDKLVTIGIPLYRRLEYLPHVLEIVASQDYPHIEVVVSNNGTYLRNVREIVDSHYPKPYKFRQNTTSVSISTHFNQILEAASGDYFILLADDDEISPNYVSELVALMERYPQASAAIALQETIDEAGNLMRSSEGLVPELLSGPDFIRAAWGTHEYGYEAFSTFVGKTKKLLECGGYPNFWKGTANDDALIIKVCLNNFVAVSTRCSYRKRYYDSSHGFALPIRDLARDIRDFLRFLDSDPAITEYARLHPARWKDSKRYLVDMAWKTYFFRWTGLYKKRLTSMQWLKAAFALPFIPEYYQAIAGPLLSALAEKVERDVPWAYKVYRAAKARHL